MRTLLVALGLLLAACGGGDGGGSTQAPPPPPPAGASETSLLFMGNSHTSFNDLPGMVAAMVRAARPGASVRYLEAPGWMFLDERATHAPSLQLIDPSRTHVVLQAQKYSSSGMFEYSTEGAEALVRRVRAAGAVPILFPEWPRRGIAETARIYDLHVSIARREPACVAPVGQAWDLARGRHPAIVLHAEDGNHSAPAGAFLAALVIAAAIGADPAALPFLPGFGVDAEVQAALRAVAAETVLVFPPRRFCPDDAQVLEPPSAAKEGVVVHHQDAGDHQHRADGAHRRDLAHGEPDPAVVVRDEGHRHLARDHQRDHLRQTDLRREQRGREHEQRAQQSARELPSLRIADPREALPALPGEHRHGCERQRSHRERHQGGEERAVVEVVAQARVDRGLQRDQGADDESEDEIGHGRSQGLDCRAKRCR